MDEKLDLYKTWMKNLSFFHNRSFIIENIENLWNLTNYIGSSFSKYIGDKYNIELNYSKNSLNETISLVQAFFEKYDINININQMIENKTLKLIQNSEKLTDKFYGNKLDGMSYYDENGARVVEVILDGTIYDAIIIIHELMHYFNQPNDQRNEVSDLLTESISYGMELIFCEELKNTEYEKDSQLHFKCLEKVLYNFAYNSYYIYKIVYLYKIKGDITEEKYNELFDDGSYLSTMDKFDEYIDEKGSIFYDTWYILGLPLAIYFFEQYKKDHSTIQYIKDLNDNINDKNLEQCFSLININSVSEFKEKIKESVESFKQYLDHIYLEDSELIEGKKI